jgi:NAD(P)H-dependent flavin oxidoreductase YrpB (nitropropane dioxygenase family)
MRVVRTRFCDLLGIEVPVVQASLGPWSTPELVAAVSNTGAVGTLGTVLRPPHVVRDQIRRVRELTGRPFIVNFSRRPFGAEQFGIAPRGARSRRIAGTRRSQGPAEACPRCGLGVRADGEYRAPGS